MIQIKSVNIPQNQKCQLNSIKQSRILSLLSSYISIKDIAQELKINKNSVYVSLKRYIKKGWINEDRTLTSGGIKKCQQTSGLSKSVNSLKPDTTRLHNLVFTISTRHLRKWKERRQFLSIRNIKFKKVGYNWDGEQIIIDNIKVWLTPLSVVLYMPNYFNDNSDLAFKNALDELFLKYIPKLESLLNISLKETNGYKIRVSRQHYGLIKNALAKKYNNDGNKLYCRDEKGLWLLIDNSLNLNELETVRTSDARESNITVQNFFNSLKDDPITVKDIFKIAEMQKVELEKWGFYAHHIESHTKSIIELKESISLLNAILKDIKDKGGI